MRSYRHPYAASRLLSVQFEAATCDSSEEMDCPLIAVEDNAFLSWWRPTVHERFQILGGAPVRVLVNYSLHGPLYLDTDSGWGITRSGSR